MIEGQLTALRAIEVSDLPMLLAWRNTPEMRQFFREHRELNLAQQLKWFDSTVNSDPNTKMFAILELNTGKLLGACGLCYIDWINRSADFSIYIGHDCLYIDTRFAPDAANVLRAYAFKQLGLHRLWAEVYSFDTKKIDLLTDINFVLEGCHRQTYWHDGSWHDSLWFSHLSTDL
jgi:RimJ/RimL family protein N-acetyltransferase